MQEELASTIKEPISVYFDTNPHDGLLETHNVDKSLEGKLKCLIFIPIISQTYCDPKSFAWQHEFCAFNKMAKDDQFGRDIKLSNGNVASRILPVKIHDLDTEDKTLLANEIGGLLRAIEFIYKEAGVNRPLKPTDGKNDNLNRTDYRNQVNKVANAIKEILSSMKNPSSISALTIGNRQSVTDRQPSSRLKKGLIASLVLIVLATAGYFLYPTLFSSGKKDELDKSIAVLPFADMSPGKDQEYFGDGIAEEIINGLAQVNNLKVIARSSSFQFKGRNEDLKTIGEMLGVATVLEGSIKKSGDKIRVTATLSKATDRTQLWSETFDRNFEDYLLIQDEITHRIVGALKVSFSGKQEPSRRMSTSEEAIKLYQQGRYFYDRNGQGDTKIALDYFSLSVKIDTGFALAWAYRAQSAGLIDSTLTNWRQYNQTALGLDPNLADAHINLGLLYWSDLNFVEAEKELRTALFLEGGNPRVLRLAGRFWVI